jgi:hypothetical protein
MSNIMPYDIVSSITVNRFEIDSIDIRLFTSAIIRVNLFGLDGFRISVKNVLMEGDDYAKWGNDDQYIITFVMNSLGFTPTPPIVEEVAPVVVEEVAPVVVEEVTPVVVEEVAPVVVEEVAPVVVEEVAPVVEEVAPVVE